jgi:hypothetical protein
LEVKFIYDTKDVVVFFDGSYKKHLIIMPKKDYLIQFIPDRFEYLTKIKKITYKDKNLKSDYIINLIHELMIKYFFTDDINSLKINLWSLILRKKYGMNYSYYVNYLIDEGFMYLVSDYFVSKKSKTYKLNYFDVGKIIKVKICDKILIKKKKESYLEKSITEYNNSPIPVNIRKKLVEDIYHVNIDYDLSIYYLDNLIKEGKIDKQKYYKNLSSIDGIKDRYLFFKFDSYGRFHSNFTILKKNIRNHFLDIDGNKVCELDIKCSQPFFLSILMKKYMNDWVEFKDVERYFFMVKEGLIYDDFMNEFKILKTRDEAKLMVYKVLFGKCKDFKKSKDMFGKLYPNVLNFIDNYKEIKGDHKIMSHDLQKIESEFIFNNVSNRIMKEVPFARFFTVHDSIIFPCNFEKEISNIFYQELNKLRTTSTPVFSE